MKKRRTLIQNEKSYNEKSYNDQFELDPCLICDEKKLKRFGGNNQKIIGVCEKCKKAVLYHRSSKLFQK